MMSLWPHKSFRPVSHIRDIQERVARRHGMTVDEMLRPVRLRSYAWARQESMWACRQILRNGEPRYSYPYIALQHGLKDHTSAYHGVKAYEKRMKDAADYMDA